MAFDASWWASLGVAGPGGRTGPLPRRCSQCRPPGRALRPPLRPTGIGRPKGPAGRGRPRPQIGKACASVWPCPQPLRVPVQACLQMRVRPGDARPARKASVSSAIHSSRSGGPVLPSFRMVILRYYLGAICTTSQWGVVSLWLSALHSPPLGVMTGDAWLTGTGMCRRER